MSALGKSIKVDDNTYWATRGKFSRVCFEIEFNKYLTRKVMVEDIIFKLMWSMGIFWVYALNVGEYEIGQIVTYGASLYLVKEPIMRKAMVVKKVWKLIKGGRLRCRMGLLWKSSIHWGMKKFQVLHMSHGFWFRGRNLNPKAVDISERIWGLEPKSLIGISMMTGVKEGVQGSLLSHISPI